MAELQVLSTDELVKLKNEGKKIFLPQVDIEDMTLLQNYDEGDLQWLGCEDEDNEIVSIEYVGLDDVQCIMVEDESHQYLTDDFMPTHNTSNILYLKSNDDDMLKTLETLSGIKHETHMNSKTITRDTTAIFGKLTGNEGKTSYTSTTNETAVVSFNDLATMPKCNCIRFSPSGSPVWSRNDTALPMSWRLHRDTIFNPAHGKTYSLGNLPTLSSAKEFDVHQFIPNFDEMLGKQIDRGMEIEEAEARYKEMYEYDDYDIVRIDQEVYADEIMDMVDEMMQIKRHPEMYGVDGEETGDYDLTLDDDYNKKAADNVNKHSVPNDKPKQDAAEAKKLVEKYERPRYAEKQLSKFDIISVGGARTKEDLENPRMGFCHETLDETICNVYERIKGAMQKDKDHFTVNSDGDLCGLDTTIYIQKAGFPAELANELNEKEKKGGNVFGDGTGVQEDDVMHWYTITNAFYSFLYSLDSWVSIANGKFESEMAREIRSYGKK